MSPSFVQCLGLSIGEDADGFVAISPTGRVRHLNHSALFILESWSEPRSCGEVADLVQAAFHLPDSPVDLVEACVTDLVEAGLLVDVAHLSGPRGPQPMGADLEVRASPGVGRGVFARRAFAEGEVIDRCPVVPLEGRDADLVQTTSLGRYAFSWGDGGSAIVLGFGSLYNHSDRPNARYDRHPQDLVMEFVAIAPISAGDEILTDYTSGGAVDLGYTPLPS